MSTYNILLSTDINYLKYCFVTCQSVVDSLDKSTPCYKNTQCKSPDKVIFNILIDDSVDVPSVEEKCNAFVSRNQCNIDLEFAFKSVSSDLFKNAPKLLNSLSTYYRLMVDKIFADDVDRVLYLDCDLLVRKDVRALFETNMVGKIIGVVTDYCAEEDRENQLTYPVPRKNKNAPEITIPAKNYFNAGVLLINVTEYRNHKVSDKCLEILEDYAPKCHDQDLLNITVPEGLRVRLSPAWNTHLLICLLGYNSKLGAYTDIANKTAAPRQATVSDVVSSDEYLECINDPAIYHYIYMKPWAQLGRVYTNLPSTTALTQRLREWFDTADKVVEFADELQPLKNSPLYIHGYELCALNDRLNNLQTSLYRQTKRRKRDRKIIYSLIGLLFMTQIIFTLVFLQQLNY